MVDYTKMKNADLEALLKERSLSHTGKKADLIKRLQDNDAQKDTTAPASKDVVEDEIDWDDDVNDGTKATTEPAAAAIAAGGQGQVANPQAVPNQEPAIDPAETKDLTVLAPNDESTEQPAPTTETTTETTSEALPTADAAPVAEKEKTPVDFSAGIAATTLEQEIEKRKARAKKFGIDESNDETLKALERQKKFGGTEAAEVELTGRLNEALPEKRERKRAAPRDTPEDTAARKRTRPGPGGRKESGRRDGGRAPVPKKGPAGGNAQPRGAKPQQMSEADRAKADARKARFASAS